MIPLSNLNLSTTACCDQLSELLSPKVELFIRDSNQVFLYMNDVYRDRLVCDDFLAKDVNPIGLSLSDIFNAESVREITDSDQQVISTKEPLFIAGYAYSKLPGLAAQYDIVTKLPLYNDAGDIIGIIGKSRCMRQIDTINGIIKLSQRQLQTIAAVFNGLSQKEIAKRLNISPRTVETYLEQVKVKLDLRKKQDIFSFILEHELGDVMSFYYTDKK